MASNKKRRPVRDGLVWRLDRVLRMEASRRVLAKHQLATLQEGAQVGQNKPPVRPRPSNEVRLRVTSAQRVCSIVSLQGRDKAGKDWLLMMGEEFCPRLPPVGTRVQIVPPWSVLRVPPGDRQVVVGLTALRLEQGGEWEPEVSFNPGCGSAYIFFADPDPAVFLIRIRILLLL